eukprot:Skav200765  [mRNA]  locus=scaffold2001:328083:331780:- [translate_table: standard]
MNSKWNRDKHLPYSSHQIDLRSARGLEASAVVVGCRCDNRSPLLHKCLGMENQGHDDGPRIVEVDLLVGRRSDTKAKKTRRRRRHGKPTEMIGRENRRSVLADSNLAAEKTKAAWREDSRSMRQTEWEPWRSYGDRMEIMW